MLYLHISSLIATVVFLYGTWHWLRGTDTEQVLDDISVGTSIYVAFFLAGVAWVALG